MDVTNHTEAPAIPISHTQQNIIVGCVQKDESGLHGTNALKHVRQTTMPYNAAWMQPKTSIVRKRWVHSTCPMSSRANFASYWPLQSASISSADSSDHS
mmetsp:Transcript_63097/g.100293  ORF Transcript_63097/g.100293 Transcript_63097/m.100293 type:complete len:99 (-) Transcript_63097:203-499(-)